MHDKTNTNDGSLERRCTCWTNLTPATDCPIHSTEAEIYKRETGEEPLGNVSDIDNLIERLRHVAGDDQDIEFILMREAAAALAKLRDENKALIEVNERLLVDENLAKMYIKNRDAQAEIAKLREETKRLNYVLKACHEQRNEAQAEIAKLRQALSDLVTVAGGGPDFFDIVDAARAALGNKP